MITSRMTSDAETTIPFAVRSVLHLKEGDEIAYAIEGDRVVLSRVMRTPIDDPFATFNEWDGEADRAAYGKL